MTTVKAGYQPLPQEPASPIGAVGTSDEQGQFLSGDNEQDLNDVVPPIGVDVIVSSRVRWINFVLGAAVLLPWNAVITAMPYFLSRLAGSALQSSFSSYLSATFTVAGFCFIAHATATSKQSNLSRRIRLSLFALALLLLLLTISTLVTLPANVFYFIVLLNCFCQSSAGGYLQTAVVAVASLFGPSVIQPVMSGQAAVGVIVSLIQVLSVGAGIHAGKRSGNTGDDDYAEAASRAAFLFFGVSTLFMVFTIASHAWLVTLPAYKDVVLPFEAKKRVIGVTQEQGAVVRSRSPRAHEVFKKGHIVEVAKMNGEFNFAVGYVFVVTLSVFPPITSSIRSVNPPTFSPFTHPLLFTALHFLMFNIGDLVGRYLPTISAFQIWSSRRLLYMSLSRTLFVPLFLLCNLQRPPSFLSPAQVAARPIINSDTLFFLILFVFGVTNGWVASLVMMAAPSMEHNPRLRCREKDIDTAATVAQFFLIGGLAVGSLMSFCVKGAICGCNPFIA